MRARRSGRTGLDPVGRWPRRQTVVRAVAAAVLLSIAAVVAWFGPDRTATPERVSADAPPAPGSTSAPPATVPPLATPGAAVPPAAAPAGAIGSAAVPPATGARVPVPAGMVGVPVPLGTPSAIALVRPGDRVDLLALAGTDPPVTIAPACPVLGVDRVEGALLLAVTPAQAEDVLTTPTSTRFAVIVQPTPVSSGQ